MMADWIKACSASDIDEEDLIHWDHGDRTYAIYNTVRGFFCTDCMCTHEAQHLDEGLVIDDVIECPLHQGRFNLRTGKALFAPACVDLATYNVEVRDGDVYIFV